MKLTTITLLSLATVTALLSGCATSGVKNPSGSVTEMRADERGFVAGTGIESQDLVTVADQMARGILSVDRIAKAAAPPYIILEPVVNETRFPINKDMFLTRIQTQLIAKSGGKVVFLARERMNELLKERDMKRTGEVTASSDPALQEFKGADYFLTGKLQGMTARAGAGTSDTILYTFQLIDARTSVIVWQEDHAIKKQGLDDAVYR